MIVFSANSVTRTVVLHRCVCSHARRPKAAQGPSGCSCCTKGNQRQFCEAHFPKKALDTMMNGRFWAILICAKCF